MENNSIINKWNNYIKASNELYNALGRTQNLVGEIAEHLACKHYNGNQFPNSYKSADFECPNNHLYQVKSRKLNNRSIISLGVIRSWDFDYLIVVLFNYHGELVKSIEVTKDVAKEYSKSNEHQKGDIIRTSTKFLNDPRNKDLTKEFISLLNAKL